MEDDRNQSETGQQASGALFCGVVVAVHHEHPATHLLRGGLDFGGPLRRSVEVLKLLRTALQERDLASDCLPVARLVIDLLLLRVTKASEYAYSSRVDPTGHLDG